MCFLLNGIFLAILSCAVGFAARLSVMEYAAPDGTKKTLQDMSEENDFLDAQMERLMERSKENEN